MIGRLKGQPSCMQVNFFQSECNDALAPSFKGAGWRCHSLAAEREKPRPGWTPARASWRAGIGLPRVVLLSNPNYVSTNEDCRISNEDLRSQNDGRFCALATIQIFRRTPRLARHTGTAIGFGTITAMHDPGVGAAKPTRKSAGRRRSIPSPNISASLNLRF